jgi:hypothetical protein
LPVPCDVLLARLATRQAGVVGVEQLIAMGFTRNEIAHRVEAERLNRVYQGVYAVGHEVLSDRGRMIATLIAAGPGAFLSHRTAAYLWKLIPSLPPFIDVTFTDRRPRSRRGLVIHQAARVNELLADPARAATMGRAGRARAVESFAWPTIAAQTSSVYRGLVA